MPVNFAVAWELVSGNEGGLSNNLKDRGGLTYRGIASKKEPGWNGWQLVIDISHSLGIQNLFDVPDTDKVTYSKMQNALDDSPEVQAAVLEFYRREWDSLYCDVFVRQELANVFFDTSVNMGRGRAVEFLQRALNALNRNQESWEDLTVDGGMGPKTLAVLSLDLVKKDSMMVAKAMSILKGAFYLDIMQRDPSQETFARGWLSRVWVI
jgi:lysozyme family protein